MLNGKINAAIDNEKEKRTMEKLEKLHQAGGVRSNEFWKLKGKLAPKTVKENAHSIMKDDREIASPGEIREAYMNITGMYLRQMKSRRDMSSLRMSLRGASRLVLRVPMYRKLVNSRGRRCRKQLRNLRIRRAQESTALPTRC